MADISAPTSDVRRTRSRKQSFNIDEAKIVDRVLRFFETDNTDRGREKEARIQRYAKYRMWSEGKDWPWKDSSDVALPDIAEKALRVQDTLVNAVMSTHPVIPAKAIDKSNKAQERSVDKLLDYQVFVEQDGENFIGDIADAFVVDGEFTVFVPWVKEFRDVSDVQVFPPIPDELLPMEYFEAVIQKTFGTDIGARPAPETNGWDWQLEVEGKPVEVKFYTRKNGDVEMVSREEVLVYDGPKLIQKEWDEVLYPARAANLHIPGPSNPHGAGHVILVDYPSKDEIRRLAADGTYDRLTKKDLDALDVSAAATDNQEMRDEKDTIQGTSPSSPGGDKDVSEQETVTRLMCFDLFDAGGSGQAENMVWWVIKDTESLARAMPLTEVFPSSPPRRPLIHQSFIPVRGRVSGISLPEIMEGLHDHTKMAFDQMAGGTTLANVPFFFYRPSGSMQPEVIRYEPGEGYPLQDPQRDVNFVNFPHDQSAGLNIISLLTEMQEKVTLVGDLQEGRVPHGKASALRTFGATALIAGQGEARPERILRRFFNGIREIYRLMHGLNKQFLSETKKIRVIGLKDPSEDPFVTIGRDDVSGNYEFEFSANVLNTSKLAMQESIEAIMGVYISDLALQLGIIDAAGIFKLFRLWGEAHGQDPDQIINPPSADALKPKIFAEEAFADIMENQIPDGVPAEAGGAAEHVQKLQVLMANDEAFGLLNEQQVQVFIGYLEQVGQRAALEQRQAQLMAAAQSFGQGQGGGQPGAPTTTGPPPNNTPQLRGTELRDETLPGAGGGANTGAI